MKVVGVYLAAGDSRRMGTNKLLLDLDGNPLGSLALQAALESTIHRVLVITKKNDKLSWIAPHLFTSDYRRKWTSVQLKKSNRGQAYSIITGLHEAIILHADAVLVQLADQPFVTANMINLLIDAFEKKPSKLFFSCSYDGVLRPPVLFTKNFFPILMDLKGDNGARDLLNGKFKEKGEIYNFDKEDFLLDVDTMDDYLKFKK
ncbi:nucleotidyltransferase family protein [Niallia endozanthoxylica]|uniref:NTP transferase domain-containing protein n=1 Tax=Niallia endozanthoxylica TaxID=2036016 RepID=A0A5J5HSY2_9BACI|nr:nucleotidyltransferase family protein [Niallia endozanthoxylica]KAA9024001.1 NTP transferase domain-containing protein [Niallia endozanthoxylica]